MAKKLINVRLEQSQIDMINTESEKNYDGNNTAAIESMLNQSESMRSIPESVRWAMYSAAKNTDWYEDKNTRTLIDGLYI